MNLINNIFSTDFISALGWTIANSIWQGAVIALLLSFALVFSGKRSSNFRWMLSTLSLFILFSLSVNTFVKSYNPESSNYTKSNVVEKSSTVQKFNSEESSTFTNTGGNLLESYLTDAAAFINHNLHLIVSIYLFGIIFFMLKLLGGLAYTQRLKHYRTTELGEGWNKRLDDFRNKLNISKKVKLFESSLINVPAVIGHFKPVILLPLGTVTGIPPEQIEAILVHELAHIRRFDYLLNLFQSFFEVLFFYHPAVWWISSVIKEERENSCDDIVVDIVGDRLTYAKALFNINSKVSGNPAPAMSLAGKKQHLKRRINRMVTQKNNQTFGGKFAATAVLVITIFVAAFYSCSSSDAETLSSNNDNYYSYNGGKRTLTFYENGTKWKVYLIEDKIDQLYKDGERIPDDEIAEYSDIIYDKVDEYYDDIRDVKKSKVVVRDEIKDVKRNVNRIRHNYKWDYDRDKFRRELRELKRELRKLKNIRVDVNFDKESFRRDMRRLRDDLRRMNIDVDMDIDNGDLDESMRNLSESLKDIHIDIDPPDIDIDIPEPPRIDMSGLHESLAELKDNLKDLDIDMSELKAEMKKLKAFLNELKYEMEDDGLIDNADEDFDMDISNTEMYVNGKRVPDHLFQKYKRIYVKHFGHEPDDHFRIHR